MIILWTILWCCCLFGSNWPFLLKCICFTGRIGLIFSILLLQFLVSGGHMYSMRAYLFHIALHIFCSKGFHIIGQANLEWEKHCGLPFVPLQTRSDALIFCSRLRAILLAKFIKIRNLSSFKHHSNFHKPISKSWVIFPEISPEVLTVE